MQAFLRVARPTTSSSSIRIYEASQPDKDKVVAPAYLVADMVQNPTLL